jgi:hypothetical protein
VTLKQAVAFLATHVALVAIAMWFNLAVLCQGDPKFDGGCGGFGLYIPLWEMFLAPLPIAAIALELWKKSAPVPHTRIVGYLIGILVVAEAGFLLVEKFPVLLALEAFAFAIGVGFRWRTVRRAAAASAAA